MTDVRILGVPAMLGGLDTLLREWFGYEPIIRDHEHVIPENDSALREGPNDILKMHPQINLRSGQLKLVAEEMVSRVPEDFDQYMAKARADFPKQIKIPGSLGLITDLELVRTEMIMASKDRLSTVVEQKLLPLMIEKFRFKHVVPVTISAALQQSYFSLSKVCLLSQEFGAKEAGQLVRLGRATRGIEMASLDVLYFVDALTRLSPVAFTFPIKHLGCAWHFYGDGFPILPAAATRSLFDQSYDQVSPRYSDWAMMGLGGLSNMHGENIWRLLRFAVMGINRLFAYLNDPRSFVDDDGVVDFHAQLQAFGAIHMLFADLIAVNGSTAPHSRITFSFGFLDKMANLRKNLGGVTSDETSLFKGLASLSQGKDLKRLVRLRTSEINPSFTDAIVPGIGNCYGRIHRHLGQELPTAGRSEANRLLRLRNLRNLSHGTYLHGDHFDQLFLRSKGTVPNELVSLPFGLALGLVSDPIQFLGFHPEF